MSLKHSKYSHFPSHQEATSPDLYCSPRSIAGLLVSKRSLRGFWFRFLYCLTPVFLLFLLYRFRFCLIYCNSKGILQLSLLSNACRQQQEFNKIDFLCRAPGPGSRCLTCIESGRVVSSPRQQRQVSMSFTSQVL